RVNVCVHNAGDVEKTVALKLTVTDYFDRVVAGKELRLNLAPHATAERTEDVLPKSRGFFKVRATLDGNELRRNLRVAVIPKYTRTDSVIGINHAYGCDALVKACVDAGILWDRDWSFKWEDVERERGTFDFTEIDPQVDRERRLGHVVLGLVPFPSANWSSSAPASVNPKREAGNRDREAWKPRDPAEFASFVSRTVAHFRGRVRWWQVFNEPLYTSYALPRRSGDHTVEDYLALVETFHKAARAADPNCLILAGPGGFAVGTDSDLDRMLKLGLLKWCDALDLHTYPRWKPPEAMEKILVRVGEMMDAAGGRKPVWLTEHGYYAEDDPVVIPPTLEDFCNPLPTERMQAEYAVRFNLILLRHGVRKIFYHAGTTGGLNRDNIQGVFFRYEGEPRKIYVVIAAFTELFGPDVQFVGELPAGKDARAFLFRDGRRLVLAAWQPRDGQPAKLRVTDGRIRLRDVVGNDLAAREAPLGPAPVYAVADGLSPEDFEKAVRIIQE
ncbi:MAG TPA: endo-1,4-beta-xylanase, partial [Planctomycetota bacterium]|nr:endo-1,4-beta-xylanase [Planctomycetota bacterium]